MDGNADSGVAWVRANRFCLVGFSVGFLPFDTSFAYWSLGALVTDRFPRRRLLSVFQGLGAMAALLVLFAFLNGSLTYVQLALFSFIQGGIWALDWPTRRAIIPDLVGRERVVDALVLENGFRI